jgi:Ca2+-binding RTX toxin-like protein
MRRGTRSRGRRGALLVAVVTVAAGASTAAAHALQHPSAKQPTTTILGTAGADVVQGTSGPDLIRAQAGDDRIFGHADGDLLYGMGGADLLDGGAGADTLAGGVGNDHIDARDTSAARDMAASRPAACVAPPSTARCLPLPASADLVSGGSGDDVIQTRDGHPDGIICGGGRDLVIADTSDLFTSRSKCEQIRTPRLESSTTGYSGDS